MLVAVRVDDGRYAGAVGVDAGTSQIGGWPAPHARGHGLGAELFGAAALLGHAHLGLRTVRAGHEPMNMASARALTKAGFVADDGPATPCRTAVRSKPAGCGIRPRGRSPAAAAPGRQYRARIHRVRPPRGVRKRRASGRRSGQPAEPPSRRPARPAARHTRAPGPRPRRPAGGRGARQPVRRLAARPAEQVTRGPGRAR
ncbi:GNAT family N-acetyltransferase [Streptomyces sp. NPDC086182]|uniref:GNAT family N-acetyltransferase n=1 Tax=Streptomyces sp. NPDC086182 TaxID=3155058 RepID=UPI003440A1D7